ncbi:type II toxin-antitoxin system death-on-curing family toxin [Vampirovibrio chlorellavorus]|uniref:type II toxin-antitoxin system death-on-curing family toxin n=1 Tax=Vampirovibrio chlorellavorus TaxID=758823 RepID=UPI0026EA0CCD|nr:type II toxin-antitoxin system death-on-curing family toxin [Vampirovibrio chlorellavorus]
MSHNFPTLQEALAIHRLLIAEFGGHPGVRDMGALEAALFRPQLGYYEGLIEEAAALMESLANNHPFIDGNKRVALFMTDTFLRMNGQYIDCDNTKTYQDFMNWFETGQFRFDKLLWWLSSVVKPL